VQLWASYYNTKNLAEQKKSANPELAANSRKLIEVLTRRPNDSKGKGLIEIEQN